MKSSEHTSTKPDLTYPEVCHVTTNLLNGPQQTQSTWCLLNFKAHSQEFFMLLRHGSPVSQKGKLNPQDKELAQITEQTISKSGNMSPIV